MFPLHCKCFSGFYKMFLHFEFHEMFIISILNLLKTHLQFLLPRFIPLLRFSFVDSNSEFNSPRIDLQMRIFYVKLKFFRSIFIFSSPTFSTCLACCLNFDSASNLIVRNGHFVFISFLVLLFTVLFFTVFFMLIDSKLKLIRIMECK